MRKNIAFLIAIIMMISLTACGGGDLKESEGDQQQQEQQQEQQQDDTSKGEQKELELASSIDLNIALGNNQRTITYQQSTPLELPSGKVVTQGELKPTWQYIQEQLGITLNDVTVQDQSASEMLEIAAATNFTNATVYGGNGIAEDFLSYGPQGYLVNLNDYMDYMPNFAKYLEENPNIKTAITAYDGGIYHVPYIAEIGNYARAFHGRQTWVTALLDSTDQLEDETATLEINYEGFWGNKRHDKNVIELQNAAANNNVLDRDTALQVLVDYINETYPDLEKPSDLYLGETAQYDIDELIALWRVIKLSPNTLSKVSSGSVVDGAVISPFFVRKSGYREDVLRLATYFGGQRVHGSDSYGSRFYLDENGELQYSYAEDGFIEIVDYIKDLYAEGLIHSEFSDTSNKDDFRKEMYGKDKEEGHKQFGFMTYDWFASTTAANEDVVAFLPPLTTVGSSDEFIYFLENTRAIKPDGWAISAQASQEEINAAITLFDFFFSEEGRIVQNYGIPEGLEENEKFVAPDGTEYPKFKQWVFDKAQEFKNGDISAFLRDFMGSLIPIGYPKEIGFELQYTNERGQAAWALHQNKNVIMTSYDAENPLFRLVPPVFALTEQDLAKIATTSVSEDQVDTMFLYITGDYEADSAKAIQQLYEDAGIDKYIQVYRDAYARMQGN
ncbi:type 2 periplasmic-binding domain-containing protein [Defluviitalea phaphyphila]|uniref:hypothetical protein n=1 Tax=Defluviitalea phaphyphila TaxID=1473580 RepID=UPI000731B0F2|nr:hypothetical protein [Defluviitalea phaphyphila]